MLAGKTLVQKASVTRKPKVSTRKHNGECNGENVELQSLVATTLLARMYVAMDGACWCTDLQQSC
jgi:hypothetical protein